MRITRAFGLLCAVLASFAFISAIAFVALQGGDTQKAQSDPGKNVSEQKWAYSFANYSLLRHVPGSTRLFEKMPAITSDTFIQRIHMPNTHVLHHPHTKLGLAELWARKQLMELILIKPKSDNRGLAKANLMQNVLVSVNGMGPEDTAVQECPSHGSEEVAEYRVWRVYCELPEALPAREYETITIVTPASTSKWRVRDPDPSGSHEMFHIPWGQSRDPSKQYTPEQFKEYLRTQLSKDRPANRENDDTIHYFGHLYSPHVPAGYKKMIRQSLGKHTDFFDTIPDILIKTSGGRMRYLLSADKAGGPEQ